MNIPSKMDSKVGIKQLKSLGLKKIISKTFRWLLLKTKIKITIIITISIREASQWTLMEIIKIIQI